MSDAPFMHSPDDLKRWMEAGSKPREAWRIGTEHENSAIAAPISRRCPMTGRTAFTPCCKA